MWQILLICHTIPLRIVKVHVSLQCRTFMKAKKCVAVYFSAEIVPFALNFLVCSYFGTRMALFIYASAAIDSASHINYDNVSNVVVQTPSCKRSGECSIVKVHWHSLFKTYLCFWHLFLWFAALFGGFLYSSFTLAAASWSWLLSKRGGSHLNGSLNLL